MSTLIAVLGGVGLFLLGMTVMTAGLKDLAGSSLRTILGKAAASPVSGAFWGAIVTLIVQSSSATTMTTIGLVSAGLLTFPQGLGLVFGANIGTTGTGWLVALIGVRVSLTAAALPMIFVGAMIKLLFHGRASAAGAALAGFALVLYGLTTLQQGMGGLAESLHPADLPAVLGASTTWWAGVIGLGTLIIAGLAMTAVMQSSTAAIAITLSAHYAGAIGLDQACALIIGQNIGTATSSAMAAIGASTTAKRLALAYILFKLIAAAIAVVLFPLTTPLLLRAAHDIDGVTLLAAYHTAYNVVGVAVLLPLITRFTRFVEGLLPERGSTLTRCLDPAAHATPLAAVEAVRRTVARALTVICTAVESQLAAANPSPAATAAAVGPAADALEAAREFLSESRPPESTADQQRLTGTLHALEHASRLAEVAAEDPGSVGADQRASDLCSDALRGALAVSNGVATIDGTDAPDGRALRRPQPADPATAADVRARLANAAQTMGDYRATHRAATLGAVAKGELTADAAIAQVDAVRRLEAITRHATRAATYLSD